MSDVVDRWHRWWWRWHERRAEATRGARSARHALAAHRHWVWLVAAAGGRLNR